MTKNKDEEIIKNLTADQIIEARIWHKEPYENGGYYDTKFDLLIDGKQVKIQYLTNDEKLIKGVEEKVKTSDFLEIVQGLGDYAECIYHHYEILTDEVAAKIRPGNIIYGEYSAGGAMGDCGTARLYTFVEGIAHYYLCSIYSHDSAELKGYDAIYELLTSGAESKSLDYCYGGFGNYAYKQKGITFKRDDNNDAFIYRYEPLRRGEDSLIRMYASVKGVYMHVVNEFAGGEVTSKMILEWKNTVDSNRLDPEEIELLNAFIAYYDKHKIETTVEDYMNALSYIRHINYLDAHYDYADWIEVWIASMAKYRLRYLVDTFGDNRVQSVFANYKAKKSKPGDLFKLIKTSLDVDVSTLFTKYTIENRNDFDIEGLEEIRYPVVVLLPKEVHESIVKEILECKAGSLRALYSLGFYLADCLYCLDSLELNTILPAVFHVLRTMPQDDFNHSHTEITYWVAAELVNRAWVIIDDPKAPEWFEKELFDSCWAQIDGIWPLKHYGEYRFVDEIDSSEPNPVAESIFNEALGFVLAIDDVKKYNPELDEFLNNLSYSNHPQLKRRVFTNSLKDKSPKEVIKAFSEQTGYEFRSDTGLAFYFPEDKKKAKILIGELLKGDDGIMKDGFYRKRVWRELMYNPHKIGVGSYIINEAVKNFDFLLKEFEDDLPDLFFAACTYPEADMLEPLKMFKEKVSDLPKVDKKALESALAYAKRQAAMFEFQRKVFLKNKA